MDKYTQQDIMRIRKQLGLTQQQLAQKLGCSGKAVSAWERGFRNPSGTACTAIRELVRQSRQQ